MKDFVGLLLAEADRARSRRLFWLLGIVTLGVVLLVAVVTFVQASDDPDSGLAEARADYAQCVEVTTQEFPDAREHPERYCGTVEDLRSSHDNRFDFADSVPDGMRGVAIALFGFSLLIAASFVGAEWGSGSMTTFLTWEPRRGRVLAAKAITISVLLAVAIFVLLAFISVLFYGIAAIRGITAGTDGGTWWTLAGIWLRGSALASFAGMLGVGLATYTRNTAGAIGIGLGYTLIVDPLLGAWREGRYRTWLFQDNFTRLMGFPSEIDSVSPGGFETGVLPPTRPLLLFAIYGVGLLLAGYWFFRTRDVS